MFGRQECCGGLLEGLPFDLGDPSESFSFGEVQQDVLADMKPQFDNAKNTSGSLKSKAPPPALVKAKETLSRFQHGRP